MCAITERWTVEQRWTLLLTRQWGGLAFRFVTVSRITADRRFMGFLQRKNECKA